MSDPQPPTFDAHPAKTYSIKPGYQHRTKNATLEENAGDYWNPTRLLLSRYAQRAVYELAAKLVQQQQHKTVLDVGCGLGHKLHELLHPLPNVQVTGIDQPTCVQASQKLLPDLNLTSADFEQPHDTGLGTFDLVLSVDVIEHLLDPDKLLNFIKAHAHPNSTLLISTPERDLRRGPQSNHTTKAEHVREWNQTELRNYLESAGLSVTEQHLLPAFKVGASLYMIKERIRLIRKRKPLNYTQVAVCKLKPSA